MKTMAILVGLALTCMLHAGEKARFETAKKPKIGESNAFELSKHHRAVMKVGGDGYVVLELIDSSVEGDDRSFIEACSVAWTLITPSSVESDVERAFIGYRSTEPEKNGSTIEAIAGSDEMKVGGVSFRWSYGSPDLIFIYPQPGAQYTTIEVEHGGTVKPTAVPESAVEGKSEAE